MNKPLDEKEKWILLKSFNPSYVQKEVTRKRIHNSISQKTSTHGPHLFLQWKGILATCVLFVICGGLIWHLIGENKSNRSLFTWALSDVHGESINEEIILYREEEEVPVGKVKVVTEDEKNQIIRSSPMFVNEQLDNFPYPTTMYIEHVKTIDTMQRYHFFIEDINGKSIYFSFDYPKLEYAEIFDAMYSLRLNGREPHIYQEQLYVRHGYGEMIFPVGLQPLTIDTDKEVYLWEEATNEGFIAYLNQVEQRLPAWKREGNTFIWFNGENTIKVTLDNKELTYEFTYANTEE
ncbi:hypothetical protein EKG37_18515 [Robertmurraya yapensis]|uniref:Uncharacterized protein n=2 Tax=Bacillaceae TaxID=186817 RepID=A0A431VXC4_9BACI|nr:hypothetical protein [Bacillus yapensis]RTR27881.1 hypothetical protein EKG37_18515 [Bacillus yapensis]TKS94284.1 hypothetical protein FAR12_18525 [Bacillus yapensis]